MKNISRKEVILKKILLEMYRDLADLQEEITRLKAKLDSRKRDVLDRVNTLPLEAVVELLQEPEVQPLVTTLPGYGRKMCLVRPRELSRYGFLMYRHATTCAQEKDLYFALKIPQFASAPYGIVASWQAPEITCMNQRKPCDAQKWLERKRSRFIRQLHAWAGGLGVTTVFMGVEPCNVAQFNAPGRIRVEKVANFQKVLEQDGYSGDFVFQALGCFDLYQRRCHDRKMDEGGFAPWRDII